MYSEQMMREQGFDDGPEFLLAMHTDAIWRACRIILDVRMHRGEMTVDEATAFLIEHTGLRARQRPGRGLPLHLHAHLPAELSARQGPAPRSSLRRAEAPRRPVQPQGLPRHAAPERLAADQLPPPAAGDGRPGLAARARPRRNAGHPVDRRRERPIPHRLLARRLDGRRLADRSAGTDRRAVRGHGRAADPRRRLGRRQGRRPGQSGGDGPHRRPRGRATPGRRGHGGGGQHPPRVCRRSNSSRPLHGGRGPAGAARRLPLGGRRLAGRRARHAAGAHCRVSLAPTRYAEPRGTRRPSWRTKASGGSCCRWVERVRTSACCPCWLARAARNSSSRAGPWTSMP